MSGRKLNHHSLLLAALAALALATGCRLFRPDVDATSGTASPSDINQASFEAEDGEANKGFGLEDLYPDNLGKTVKRVVSEPPNKKEAKKTFDDADAIFRQANALPVGDERQKLFLEAARKFLIAAERFPNSALEQESLYMAGEAYFQADYYWESNRSYEKLIKAYPNNRYLDEVEKRRYAIARYWLDVSKKSEESLY